MNISDIIRGLLTKLDTIQQPEPTATIIIAQEPEGELSPLSMAGGSEDDEELARMKQIAGLLPTGAETEYANEPQEMYADIDSITKNAGGGVNGPKHPADIRGEHPSMYPAYQAGFGE
jgi:hypothetical protein